MAAVVLSGSLLGVEGASVAVEVDLLRRLPSVVIVGLPGSAVRESAERVRSEPGAGRPAQGGLGL